MANIPPPPVPATPAPPPEPLSVPQTEVQLPPPQPLDPAALPPLKRPEPAAAAPERTEPSTPVIKQPPSVGGQAPRAEPPATPPAAVERPRLQEIVPADQQRHIREAIEARRREIQVALDQAAHTRLSQHDRSVADRVRSFLQQVDDALQREDLVQADALSERALILSRELPGGK